MLSTIEVRPGRDPAYRIMQSVIDHAKENDPNNLKVTSILLTTNSGYRQIR